MDHQEEECFWGSGRICVRLVVSIKNTRKNKMTKNVTPVENLLISSIGLTQERIDLMMRRVEKLYDAGGVKRMHTVPTLRPYTVAEHVYGSMLIASELYHLNHKVAASRGLSFSWERIQMSLLFHDAPEVDTGDIPAPVKRASHDIRHAVDGLEQKFYEDFEIPTVDLNEIEVDVVKTADTLDLVAYCVRERLMGNRHPMLWQVFENAQVYAREKGHLEGVNEMRTYFRQVWESV